MANIPIAFIIAIIYFIIGQIDLNLHTSCTGPCDMSTFEIFCQAFIFILSFAFKVKNYKTVIICTIDIKDDKFTYGVYRSIQHEHIYHILLSIYLNS